MIVDAHAHLQLCAALPEPGLPAEIGLLITNATGPEDWETTLGFARRDPERVVAAVGVHPWNAAGLDGSALAELERLLRAHPDAGVGECGLDRVRTDPARGGCPFELQERAFRAQLDLAVRLGRPLSLHCVRAWGPLLEVLEERRGYLPAFMVHAFGGSAETAVSLCALGGWISFAPFNILPERAARVVAAIRAIPPDRLLLDSDYPPAESMSVADLPRHLEKHLAAVSALTGEPAGELREQTAANLRAFLSR